MKPAGRIAMLHGRTAGWLLAAAFALAVPLACRDADEPSGADMQLEKAAERVFGSRKGLRDELQRIITASQTGTTVGRIKLGQEELLQLRAPAEFPASFAGAKEMPREQLGPDSVAGETMTTTAEVPSALAMAPDGSVIYAAGGRTWRVVGPGAAPVELLPDQAIVLQIQPTSGELLLQAGQHSYLAAAPGYELVRPLPEPLPAGRPQWDPVHAGSLLFFREYVDFDASNPDRISLTVQRQSLDGATREPVHWLARHRLAEAGTLPAAGAVWGHVARRYQVRPHPAPIVLFPDATTSVTLTAPGRAVDLSPAASTDGARYWVRTARRGSSTGRGYMQLAKKAAAVPLTAAATDLISVAPDGNWLALAVRDGKGSRLVRMDPETRRRAAEATAAITDPSDVLRERADVLNQGMKLELRRLGRLPDLVQNDFGLSLNRAPDAELVLTMGDRMRERLERGFGVTLSPGLAGLKEADALLDDLVPYLDENPWLVLGVTGLFARALPEERVRWLIRPDDLGLGQDVSAESTTDGLSFTATSPFYIARERLTNGLQLTWAARRLLEENPAPTYLVENLSDEVLKLVRLEELKSASLGTTVTSGKLHDLLRDNPPNAAICVVALNAARDLQDRDLAMMAGWRLAQARPHSGRALGKFAGPLKDVGFLEESLLLLNQAVALDPLNADLHFQLADALTMLDRLAAARAEYARALAADTDGSFAEDVAARLRLLDDMEGKPGS